VAALTGHVSKVQETYRVKTDEGAERFISNAEALKPEPEGERPADVVPDIEFEGAFHEPNYFIYRITSIEKQAKQANRKAFRARKPENKAMYRDLATRLLEEAKKMRRTWNEWTNKYPEEAEKYAGKKPAEEKPPAMATKEGITVTENEARDGIEIRFAEKPSDEIRNRLKAAKFRYSRKQNLWYAKRSDKTRRIAVEIAGGKTEGVPEVPAKIEVVQLGPQVLEKVTGKEPTPKPQPEESPAAAGAHGLPRMTDQEYADAVDRFKRDLERRGVAYWPDGTSYMITTIGEENRPVVERTIAGNRETIVGMRGSCFDTIEEARLWAVQDAKQRTEPTELTEEVSDEAKALAAAKEPTPEGAGKAAAAESAKMAQRRETAFRLKGKPIEGTTSKAFTSKGTEIESQYTVVPIGAITTSHDSVGRINSLYPAELQPRDRTRIASKVQIRQMANTINPELLGESAQVTGGAPIAGPDMAIESGNARTIALRLAYREGRADQYKDWLIKNAEKFGLDAKAVEAMDMPVLVRVRQTDLDRTEFAKEANQAEIASMSPTELAFADAQRISDEDMGIYAVPENGNVLAASNRGFIRSFLNKLGKEETAQYLTKEGNYTKQLADRIQAAVFAKAYEDERLLSLMAEEADVDIKNIISALNMAASSFSKARAVEPSLGNLNIIPHLVEGAELVRRAKNAGMRLDEFLSQMDMFSGPSPSGKFFATFFDINKRSAKRMGEGLRAGAEFIRNDLQRRLNVDMFSTEPSVVDDVLRQINKAIKELYGERADQYTLEIGDRPGEPYGRGRKQSGEQRAAAEITGAEETIESGEEALEGSQLQYIYHVQSPTAKEQLSLFDFKPAKRREAGRHLLPSQRVRTHTTGSIRAAGRVVSSAEEAASLLASIRKSAQELFFTVTTDKDGIVLEVHRYAKGTRTGAIISPTEVAGRALNIDGAAHVFAAHNHPSGTVQASSRDFTTLAEIAELMKAGNVRLTGLIIGDTRYSSIDPQAKDITPARPIKPSLRKTVLPVKERMLAKKHGFRTIPLVQNSIEAKAAFERYANNEDGVLFLDARHHPVAFFPFITGRTMKETTRDLLKLAESSGAGTAVINLNEYAFNKNRYAYALGRYGIGDLPVLDIIDQGVSLADSGELRNLQEGTQGAPASTRFGTLLSEDIVRFDRDESRRTEPGTVLRGQTPAEYYSAPTRYPPRRHAMDPEAGRPLPASTPQKIKAHPRYQEAKAGDHDAALDVVEALVKPQSLQRAKERFGAEAIYVPIVAVETEGHNRLPRALAEYYAYMTGARADEAIHQTNYTAHTGKDMLGRMLSRPTFAGSVQPGVTYVLVDDVVTSGGTFAELAGYIQENGGKVIGTVVLANASRSGTIAVRAETLARIKEKFGNAIFEEIGIEAEALTQPEAVYLNKLKDVDSLRNRVLEARRRQGQAGAPPASEEQEAYLGGRHIHIGDAISLEDIKDVFPGQQVGQLQDGSYWVQTAKNQAVVIKVVDRISADRARFRVLYGRGLRKGEPVVGRYSHGTIELQRILGDRWTLRHESVHWMEDAGILSPRDVRTLKQKIVQLAEKGEFTPINPHDIGGAEDRANFIAQELEARRHPGVIRKIITKIQGWIDRLVNLFQRTPAAIVREVESGRIFEREPAAESGTLPPFYSIGKQPTGTEAAADIKANRSFVNKLFEMRDVATFRIQSSTTQLQKEVQELAGAPSRRKLTLGFAHHPRLKRSQASDELDKAMMVYRDLQANPGKADEFKSWAEEKLADPGTKPAERLKIKRQLKTLDKAVNLTEAQKEFVEKMGGLFDDAYRLAEEARLIQTHRDHYVRRLWKLPEGEEDRVRGTGTGHGFKTWTTAAKPRTLETILDGWMEGHELRVEGITNSYDHYMRELATIMANKAFIQRGVTTMDATGNALFTTKSRPGYAPLQAKGFTVWRWAGRAEAEKELEDAEALAIDTYGRKFFATVPEKIPAKWAVYESAEATRAARVFEDKEEAETWAAEQGYDRIERRAPKDVSDLFEKQPLYAPKPLAELINKMTATDTLFNATPAARTLLRLNTGLKSWILLSSFFHHLAGARSWVFGIHHGWKNVNPVRAYKDGLDKISDLHPLVELGVKNGLTLGTLQDWSEQELRDEKGFAERLANYLGLEKTVKVMEHGRFKREQFTDSLFKKFFAGLKAEAFVLEYSHELQKATEKYNAGKLKAPPNPDEIAERVARLINADFGGLHLQRMGRSPTIQKAVRMLLLAPDWCVLGDTRAMTKTGWKYYHELEIGDEIMAFNPATKKLEWSRLKDKYVNEQYSGKIIKIKNFNRAVAMTPEHKCYVRNFTTKKYEIVKAHDLQTNHLIPRCADFDAPTSKTYSDFFVKLVGWMVTDGHIKKSPFRLADGSIKIYRYGRIRQAKPRTVKILKDMGLEYHNRGYSKNHDKFVSNYPTYSFRIPKDEFAKMEEIGVTDGLNWEFLSKLTHDQRKLLYDTMMLADGTGQRRFCGREYKVFYMTLLQTMMGLPTTFYQQEKHCWRTRWITRGKEISCWGHHDNKVEEDYQGTIWCPSVETGFWLAEREGLMFITGNTESNFRTVTGMIPGANKRINRAIGDIPGPEGMDEIYRKFWGRVLLRLTISTVLAQVLLNGSDESEDFLKEQMLSNRFNKLRWTEIEVTRLYEMLGIDTEGQRKTFSPGGHFWDPLKLIDPFRLGKAKASPFMRVVMATFSGSDWADRPFTGAKELVTTGKTVKKSVYEQKEGGLNRLPSVVVNQAVNMQPIQVGHFIRYLQGEEDGLTALMHSAGAATHTAWEPRLETPLIRLAGKDRAFDEVERLTKSGALHMGPPSRYLTIAGESRRMNAREYDRYLRNSSAIALRKLLGLMATPRWQHTSDERKAERLVSIIRSARKKVRARLKRSIARMAQRQAA
jgi:adenine/guanine phosphoribosyltransferase-like PRPP-binding protein